MLCFFDGVPVYFIIGDLADTVQVFFDRFRMESVYSCEGLC